MRKSPNGIGSHRLAVSFILRVARKAGSIAALICWSITGFTQKEADNWYFGYGAGLDFSKGSPVFQKGKINQWEGCASISDGDGKLLFYTNGRFVWDRNHKVMPKGTGLKGNNSSTQSSIIVPAPGSRDKYYLFTVAAEAGYDGLQYSVVDMHANDGLGDIASKNILLITPVCEKITAVRHSNNRDIWVIAHRYNSDEYCAYLVTGAGIDTQAVISQTGNTISGGLNTIGYLKASPNGTKLAAAHMTSFIEVLDFDPATGRISNPLKLVPKSRSYPYGVEFSKKAEFLYSTEMAHTSGGGSYSVFQYRVSSNADSMMASKYTVASGNVGGAAGAVQLAPDNRMYIAFNGRNFLGCILYPDMAGEKCGFELEHISLPGAKSGLGLPSFIQSYFVHAGASTGYLKYAAGFALLLILMLLFIWMKRRKKRTDRPVAEAGA